MGGSSDGRAVGREDRDMSAVIEPNRTHSGVRIRSMRDADIDRVMEVEQTSYEFPWTTEIFRDCLRVGYHCPLLVCDQEIVGYAIFSMAVGEAHLLNLCVRRDRQGQGHGSRLLDHVLDNATRAGCIDLFLEVRPSNQAALSLYRRFGFRSIGTRPEYYRCQTGREDAFVLTTSLASREKSSVFVNLPADTDHFKH